VSATSVSCVTAGHSAGKTGQADLTNLLRGAGGATGLRNPPGACSYARPRAALKWTNASLQEARRSVWNRDSPARVKRQGDQKLPATGGVRRHELGGRTP
jgi:hypothetical protein